MTVNSDISTNSRSRIFVTILGESEAAGLNGPEKRREEVGGMDVEGPDGNHNFTYLLLLEPTIMSS